MKACSLCGLTLPLDAFYQRSPGRPHARCRTCYLVTRYATHRGPRFCMRCGVRGHYEKTCPLGNREAAWER